jgi:hypothetical protein
VWVIGYDGKEKLVNLDNIVEIYVLPIDGSEEWKVEGRVIASGGYEEDFGMDTITLFRGDKEACEVFFNDLKTALMDELAPVSKIVKWKRGDKDVRLD